MKLITNSGKIINNATSIIDGITDQSQLIGTSSDGQSHYSRFLIS